MTAGFDAGRLDGQVAIVSGGGWNIGRAVASRFAAAGARVVVAGRGRERLAATVDAIAAAGGEAHAVPTDVTDPAAVDALVAAAEERFGPVDVLAAIAGGGLESARLDEQPFEEWRRVFELNLYGTLHQIRAVLPGMRARGRGSVLLCTGGGGPVPMIEYHATSYACAKAAICRLTDQLTAELLETPLRVNCLEPGLTWSPEALAAVEREETASGAPHPLRARNHPPEDAAELALWLVGPASAPLRGRIVSVDETWWRDPARVAAVEQDVRAARMWRHPIED